MARGPVALRAARALAAERRGAISALLDGATARGGSCSG
jgi:hypothetical protein